MAASRGCSGSRVRGAWGLPASVRQLVQQMSWHRGLVHQLALGRPRLPANRQRGRLPRRRGRAFAPVSCARRIAVVMSPSRARRAYPQVPTPWSLSLLALLFLNMSSGAFDLKAPVLYACALQEKFGWWPGARPCPGCICWPWRQPTRAPTTTLQDGLGQIARWHGTISARDVAT